jgi:ADP-ribose pyrophosphatase YjhB (NUDIX family)
MNTGNLEPQQAGVIAFQHEANQLRFCVTYKPKNAAWGIPKGFVDPGNTPQEAALTEAREEPGLRGELIGKPIGTYDYEKWGNIYTVAIYLMKVTHQDDHWDEESFRERHWLAFDAARARLQGHPVHELFERAIHLLQDQGDDNDEDVVR